MIDTHAHLYEESFDADRVEMIQRAKDAGVEKVILPNVDSESLQRLLELEREYPDYCYATIGLHPTSVKENFEEELRIVEQELLRREYIGIGEIGIDLYWDKTFLNEQILVFQKQLEWSLQYKIPVIIHVRDSFNETMEAMKPFYGKGLTGVFHSFTGGVKEAEDIISYGGFRLGINGIVTFKNSTLKDILRNIDIKHIVLETDAPYLTPVPYRGKRNESSYVKYVCDCLSQVYGVSEEALDKITTQNALSIFKKL
ncbi:TatD family hydrolase [Paludibacteraceae bacterium OttesenSCG-928-F17]|nr:TatD family hydrolase [Paludibacteraceae bacterium OttesenSCG-928-F17]